MFYDSDAQSQQHLQPHGGRGSDLDDYAAATPRTAVIGSPWTWKACRRRTNLWLNRHQLGSSSNCISRRIVSRASIVPQGSGLGRDATRHSFTGEADQIPTRTMPCRGLVRSPWYVRTSAPSVSGRARAWTVEQRRRFRGARACVHVRFHDFTYVREKVLHGHPSEQSACTSIAGWHPTTHGVMNFRFLFTAFFWYEACLRIAG